MPRYRRGSTIVEFLFVVAIIGVLISLLLPALQAAREAARRVQCGNNVRQIGFAMHLYHDAQRTLPPGIASQSRMFWSGYLLQYLEQQALAERIDVSVAWDVEPNATACASYLSIFRCPSSDAPGRIDAQGIDNRVPCNYLVCASGTATRESGPAPLAGNADSDGLFFIDSSVRQKQIIDGLSNTVALGEAVFIYKGMGNDHSGSPQFLDRWYIGTFEGLTNEVSEGMGSTGVAINSHKLEVFVDEKELSFGSSHPNGAHINFADGRVRFMAETIDRTIWSGLGTRNGGEIIATAEAFR